MQLVRRVIQRMCIINCSARNLDCVLREINEDDDRSFIVLTETKFSFRCIPVTMYLVLLGAIIAANQEHVVKLADDL
jgi:hypothetical protein